MVMLTMEEALLLLLVIAAAIAVLLFVLFVSLGLLFTLATWVPLKNILLTFSEWTFHVWFSFNRRGDCLKEGVSDGACLFIYLFID